MKHKFDRSFKFMLLEHEWEAHLVTEQEMEELLEDDDELDADDTPAYVEPEDRVLIVEEGFVTKEVIRHELLHAVFASYPLGSAELTPDQFEEVMAEFLAKDHEWFSKKADFILGEFKKFSGAK